MIFEILMDVRRETLVEKRVFFREPFASENIFIKINVKLLVTSLQATHRWVFFKTNVLEFYRGETGMWLT